MEPLTTSNEQLSQTTLPRLSAHLLRMLAVGVVAVVHFKAPILAVAKGMGTMLSWSGST